MGKKYRINRDWFNSRYYQVQCWRWYFPFWTEVRGLLHSENEAKDLIRMLTTTYEAKK